jgi:hypothetical protein
MIGLIIAIVLFNFIAFKTNKRLTTNQIVHIWTFTIAFQYSFDILVEFKYHGYWYFSKGIDWIGVVAHTILIPPVNMMYLNWFPFYKRFSKKFIYIFLWVIGILIYETITLLPEPWGYFHYGWWKLLYAAIVDPILLLIVLGYYKWIRTLENQLIQNNIPK